VGISWIYYSGYVGVNGYEEEDRLAVLAPVGGQFFITGKMSLWLCGVKRGNRKHRKCVC
jgi:uncharacterized membrane protein YgdD (TMEM256/DUF423 family)